MEYIPRHGYDVCLVDLRGYGRSTRPPEFNQPATDNPLTRTDWRGNILRAIGEESPAAIPRSASVPRRVAALLAPSAAEPQPSDDSKPIGRVTRRRTCEVGGVHVRPLNLSNANVRWSEIPARAPPMWQSLTSAMDRA